MRPQVSGGGERGRPLTRKWAGRAAPVRPAVSAGGAGPARCAGTTYCEFAQKWWLFKSVVNTGFIQMSFLRLLR